MHSGPEMRMFQATYVNIVAVATLSHYIPG